MLRCVLTLACVCVCVCVCVVCAVEVFFSRSLGFISIFGEGKGEVSLGAFFFFFWPGRAVSTAAKDRRARLGVFFFI